MSKFTPLRHKNENSSPTKEISSPSKLKKTPFSELAALIKSSGLILPAHLSKFLAAGGQNTQHTGFKLNSTQSQSEEIKKLKIKLIDQQFQLKKVEEDYAQNKRINRIERQKEVKKLEEACARLKNNLENNCQDSAYQIGKLKQQYQTEIKSFKERNKAQLIQEVEKVTKLFQQKLKSSQKLKAREISQLQKDSETKIAGLNIQHELQIENMKKGHSIEIKEIGMKNKQILEDKQKKFESLYTAIQSERKTQEKLHQKTKIQASKEKEKLYSEVCFERNVKKQLQEQIIEKQKQIKGLKSKIKDCEITIILNEDKYKRRIDEIEVDIAKQKKNIEIAKNQEVLLLSKNHKTEIEKFEDLIKKIQGKLQQRETIHQVQLSQLSETFSQRPSKREDVFQIERLRQLNFKKDQQIRKLVRDLKHCNLELQNKEDIYSRIFKGAAPSRQEKVIFYDIQKSLNKQKEQLMPSDEKAWKQAVFRKSQTADIKFLLKVYNTGGK